jgi:hypothetical protein
MAMRAQRHVVLSPSSLQATQTKSRSAGQLEVEIKLCPFVIEQNDSLNSYDSCADLFGSMFPDSTKIKPGKDKIAYTLTDSIFSWIRGKLRGELNEVPFSLLIDEASTGQQHLGVVRFMMKNAWSAMNTWNVPLEATDAKTITSMLQSFIVDEGFQPQNLISIMSDSCNVMRGARYRIF